MYLVQGPRRVTRQRKVQIQRQVHDVLLRIAHRGIRLDLRETVAQEPDAVDEEAVRRALDLKVAEKGVGAEERDDLVEDVVAVRVRVRRLGGGQWRVRERERVGRAADLGAQREQREVADEARVGLRVEDGVVGLEGDGVSTWGCWGELGGFKSRSWMGIGGGDVGGRAIYRHCVGFWRSATGTISVGQAGSRTGDGVCSFTMAGLPLEAVVNECGAQQR